LAGRRVLIVEDETLVALLIEDFLDELGLAHAGPFRTVTPPVQRRNLRTDATPSPPGKAKVASSARRPEWSNLSRQAQSRLAEDRAQEKLRKVRPIVARSIISDLQG
jgi:hypothetical protein